ncbi:hypothetical protein, partial [Mycobacterium marinum]
GQGGAGAQGGDGGEGVDTTLGAGGDGGAGAGGGTGGFLYGNGVDSNACCAGKDCGNAYLESKGDMTRGWGLRDEYFRAFLDSEHKRLRKKE